MNILGIGIDIVEIKRIEDALNKNKRFLDKLFTKEEIKYFESRNFKIETIAGNFAAKEAISKAMGTGIRNFNFIDIIYKYRFIRRTNTIKVICEHTSL